MDTHTYIYIYIIYQYIYIFIDFESLYFPNTHKRFTHFKKYLTNVPLV